MYSLTLRDPDFGVSTTTIYDIRDNRTWKEGTL